MLRDVEEMVDRFQEGDAGGARSLRERGLGLYERLAAHLELEDSVLAPALRASGAAGERAAERLAHEHREQRELLKYLLERLREQTRPTVLVARELRSFIDYVRMDMEHEESTLLSEELLGQREASG